MGKKILLADDSITIQKVIELTFSDEDFDVVTVGNGRLALERLPEVRPDIVLCDIIMPEKDGYEVCEQIKASPSWSHLPVLLLTGAFEPFDQERAARAGYDGSLAKPFEPETLILKVKELLARVPRHAPARPAPVDTQTSAPIPPFVAPPPTLPREAELLEEFPAVASPVGEAEAQAGFIPEEPFSGLGGSFAREASPLTIPPLPAPLAEISEEESAALAPPPFEEPAEDSVSTVMFRASDLPWGKPSPASVPAAPAAVESPEPLFVPEPPAPTEASAELADEAAVFEAVLEEDLEFGSAEYPADVESEPQPLEEVVADPFGETPELTQAEEDIFAPELTARSPVSGVGEGASGAFAALVRDQVPLADGAADTNSYPRPLPVVEPVESLPEAGTSVVPERHDADEEAFAEESLPEASLDEASVVEEDSLPEPAPEPGPEPEPFESFEPEAEAQGLFEEAPAHEAAAIEGPDTSQGAVVGEHSLGDEAPFDVAWPDEPLPAEPAELEPTPAATAPEPPALALPAAAGGFAQESFGDVAEAIAEAEPQAPASGTAALAVPVEMVEKIAQRVVAQISEKAVREIAWEVIPDLAEALIKQEIEKLKAELAKL